MVRLLNDPCSLATKVSSINLTGTDFYFEAMAGSDVSLTEVILTELSVNRRGIRVPSMAQILNKRDVKYEITLDSVVTDHHSTICS